MKCNTTNLSVSLLIHHSMQTASQALFSRLLATHSTTMLQPPLPPATILPGTQISVQMHKHRHRDRRAHAS